MIAFVEGQLAEKQPTLALIDVGGIGYEVHIPLSSYDKLPRTGASCRLLTHHHVREDTDQLFGFVSPEERTMFQMLLGVSGIGPRLALSALSGLTVRELIAAIGDGDVKRLSSISGLGRKTAERLVVELRDRLSKSEVLAASTTGKTLPEDSRARDAVMALVSLGYKDEQARKMVSAVMKKQGGADLGVEQIIKESLAR